MKAPNLYPAPWHVGNEDCDVESADNTGICSMYADERANIHAKAIAALPLCLAALAALVTFCDENPQSDPTESLACGLARLLPDGRAALLAAGFTD